MYGTWLLVSDTFKCVSNSFRSELYFPHLKHLTFLPLPHQTQLLSRWFRFHTVQDL